jgi:hypothetical protein
MQRHPLKRIDVGVAQVNLGGTGIFSHPFVMLLIPTQIFVQRPEFSVPAMTLSLEAD